MADFSEMLNGILSNPQAMQQMMALAQSLGLQGQGGQPQQAAPPAPSPATSATPARTAANPTARPGAAAAGLSAAVQADGRRRPAAGPFSGAEALRPARTGGKAGPGHPGGQNLPPSREHPAKAGTPNPIRQVNAMYNRYIPQGDGTYQRSRLPESRPPRPPRPRPPEPHRPPEPPRPAPPPCPPPENPPCPPPEKPPCHSPEPPCPPEPCPHPEPPCEHHPPHREEPCSALGFLQNLLPKNMDTGDLLMLLILLLLIQDGSEDAPSALLTIALFFLL